MMTVILFQTLRTTVASLLTLTKRIVTVMDLETHATIVRTIRIRPALGTAGA